MCVRRQINWLHSQRLLYLAAAAAAAAARNLRRGRTSTSAAAVVAAAVAAKQQKPSSLAWPGQLASLLALLPASSFLPRPSMAAAAAAGHPDSRAPWCWGLELPTLELLLSIELKRVHLDFSHLEFKTLLMFYFSV